MERIAADTAVPLPLQGLPGTSITFSPDGRHIAIGGQDGAKLCDLKTSNCSAMLQVRRQLQRVLAATGSSSCQPAAGSLVASAVQQWPAALHWCVADRRLSCTALLMYTTGPQ